MMSHRVRSTVFERNLLRRKGLCSASKMLRTATAEHKMIMAGRLTTLHAPDSCSSFYV